MLLMLMMLPVPPIAILGANAATRIGWHFFPESAGCAMLPLSLFTRN